MPFLLFIIIPLVLLVVILLISCICLVPQATAYVMEWLGVYNATWESGCPSSCGWPKKSA